MMWIMVFLFYLIVLSVNCENYCPANFESNDQLLRVPLTRFERIELHNWNDISYHGLISVGNPSQEIMVLFDTGSSAIWVPSVNLQCQTEKCETRRKFNASQSKSYVGTDEKFNAIYGSGSVDGIKSSDQILIGNSLIEQQPFGEVTEVRLDTYSGADFDGIFGLSFGANTPLDRLKAMNVISERIFCFHMNDKKSKTVSELIIGGCDVEAEFYANVIGSEKLENCHWRFNISSIQLKNTDNVGIFFTDCGYGCLTLLDTGSSIIRGPIEEIQRINNNLGAEIENTSLGYYYVLKCDKADLPNVVFNIEGNEIVLKPKDYLIPIEDNICISGFFGINVSANDPYQYILGDNVLRNVVSIFDMEKSRIGFRRLRKYDNLKST